MDSLALVKNYKDYQSFYFWA